MMHRTTAFVLLTASALVSSQDTTSNPLLQPPRPSIDTATLTSTDLGDDTATSTREVVTAATCIPQSEQVFSIQTDTEAYLSPLTITPICGQTPDASASPTGPTGVDANSTATAVIPGGVGNATMSTTLSIITSNGDDQEATPTGDDQEATPTGDDGSQETDENTAGGADETGGATTVYDGSGAKKAIFGGGLVGMVAAMAAVVML